MEHTTVPKSRDVELEREGQDTDFLPTSVFVSVFFPLPDFHITLVETKFTASIIIKGNTASNPKSRDMPFKLFHCRTFLFMFLYSPQISFAH